MLELLLRADMKHDGYGARDGRLPPAGWLKTAQTRGIGCGPQQQPMYALFGDGFRAGYPPRFINIDANTDGHRLRQNREQLTRRMHAFLSNQDRSYIGIFHRFGWLALWYTYGRRWRRRRH
jgi:hypothetical protein